VGAKGVFNREGEKTGLNSQFTSILLNLLVVVLRDSNIPLNALLQQLAGLEVVAPRILGRVFDQLLQHLPQPYLVLRPEHRPAPPHRPPVTVEINNIDAVGMVAHIFFQNFEALVHQAQQAPAPSEARRISTKDERNEWVSSVVDVAIMSAAISRDP